MRKQRQHKDVQEDILEKVQAIMSIEGQAGIVAKVCLLAGLTENEAQYCYNQEICNNTGYCNCHKLHVTNRRNGMSVIVVNWARDRTHRIYFTLLPTTLWERFRELSAFNEADVKAAGKVIKDSAGIDPSCVCKIFYSVMKKSMNQTQLDVLVGKANPCVAKCLLLSDLTSLIDNYVIGWQRIGLVLPIL